MARAAHPISVDHLTDPLANGSRGPIHRRQLARHALAEIRHGLPLRNNDGPLDDFDGHLVVGTFTLKALQLEDAVSLLAAQRSRYTRLIEWLEDDVPQVGRHLSGWPTS